MTTESYRGYTVRGFAKQLGDGSFEASGAVEKDGRIEEGSDHLGYSTPRLSVLRQPGSLGRRPGWTRTVEPGKVPICWAGSRHERTDALDH
ncbi:hypothetical protein CNECB9_3760104 [Cupriavidus necator]|uniref:Uncharacterized protein n=1 Tax=Cupriavidus necator TaxID=106590 RepID=A0A1K0IJ84_CUPNE|nr:hypothetical protein CNECB9_3760104 [Cupriavidus necator]